MRENQRNLSGGSTARKGPIGSTNHQWGMSRLRTRRPVATSALAHPVRRKNPTDGSFTLFALL
ncbi:hypothetical protein FSZ17_15340 [Cytobacillus dafuensis]|uniref:Uncharacterized protein n=1 Tax=Cytobacillus dafuensis TaxID=1742359 RepID=A0A5B8Z6G9_CYTDA|nr:hypothetical protein FSZ17_15340 [Cytobacillus dafuensis]